MHINWLDQITGNLSKIPSAQLRVLQLTFWTAAITTTLHTNTFVKMINELSIVNTTKI